MLKILCVFTASMFAMAVFGQSFVQKSISNKTLDAHENLSGNNGGLESATLVLSEEAALQLDSIVSEKYDRNTET